jgi:hypothetical protein
MNFAAMEDFWLGLLILSGGDPAQSWRSRILAIPAREYYNP